MITVSNYPEKSKPGYYRLTVKFTKDDLTKATELFGSSGVAFAWDDDDDPSLTLQPSNDSPYHLGKLYAPSSGEYRQLTIVHKRDVPVFGNTISGNEYYCLDPQRLELDLDVTRLKPARKVKRKKKSPPAPPSDLIPLKEAIQAINAHKAIMGKDLVFSVRADGTVESILRYS